MSRATLATLPIVLLIAVALTVFAQGCTTLVGSNGWFVDYEDADGIAVVVNGDNGDQNNGNANNGNENGSNGANDGANANNNASGANNGAVANNNANGASDSNNDGNQPQIDIGPPIPAWPENQPEFEGPEFPEPAATEREGDTTVTSLDSSVISGLPGPGEGQARFNQGGLSFLHPASWTIERQAATAGFGHSTWIGGDDRNRIRLTVWSYPTADLGEFAGAQLDLTVRRLEELEYPAAIVSMSARLESRDAFGGATNWVSELQVTGDDDLIVNVYTFAIESSSGASKTVHLEFLHRAGEGDAELAELIASFIVR